MSAHSPHDPFGDGMTFERHYHDYGVAIIEWALDREDLNEMSRAFAGVAKTPRKSGPSRSLPADLADWLETHPILNEIAGRLSGTPARLVRILTFEKTATANWFVPWHQDRTIVVGERDDHPGFRNWTRRSGYWQVEPPIEVLERMVTLRVHLDECGAGDGPLEVLPGTHAFGRLGRGDIGSAAATLAPQVCLADPGDILAMSPLTVHRSRRARSPSRRRVVHLEYAACDLPGLMMWASLTPDIDLI